MMNCIIWNVRGLVSSCPRLRDLIRQWSISLLVVVEPIISSSNINDLALKLGLHSSFCCNENKIWIFWDKSKLDVTDVTTDSQYSHMRLLIGTQRIWFTAIYGSHNYIVRRNLWNFLECWAEANKSPWFVGGDFNAIANQGEHKGQSIPTLGGMNEFKDCLANCDLIDLPFHGTTFTWTGVRSNGRVWRRLDRILFNSSFLGLYDNIQIQHLNKSSSDHSPMLLQCKNQLVIGPKAFKFQNMWLSHPNFMHVVDGAWKNVPTSGGMRGLYNKLQYLKQTLKAWNKNTFGDIFQDIKRLEEEVTTAESLFEANPSEANRDDWSFKQALLLNKHKHENEFWRQRAKLKWLKEGDSNTKFFHDYVKIKNRMQAITVIKDSDGNICREPDAIAKAAERYFQDIFAEEEVQEVDSILHFIPALVNKEDNQMLMLLPTSEEVKEAVWGLDKDSTAGPDGYNGVFFRQCWTTVGVDVVLAVQDFFQGNLIPKAMGSSLIALIPKRDKISTFSDFRPISLSNFISKVCTKLLATRLTFILPKLISPEQAGFMKGRDISDHVLVAQEMINSIDRKVRGTNVIVKLDMAKAFDRLSWVFLEAVLLKFGFSKGFVNLVMKHLQATHFSVLINGCPKGYFQPHRGVKQGDPLSPYLFILATEALSRGLKDLVTTKKIKPYWIGPNGIAVTHLCYADDILIFLNGEARSIHNFNKFLELYQRASGQAVNFDKSNFCCGKTSLARIRNMERLLGMTKISLPMKYLGSNLHKGINRKNYCQDILQAFDKKLTTWKQKHLNFGGRMVLIKHVLNSIPLHLLAVDTLPKTISKSLERRMSHFLWGSNANKNKFHWKRWKDLCLPYEEGGLGFRSLKDTEKAYSLKLWWKWKVNKSGWAQFCHARYPRGSDMNPKPTDSAIWKRICQINSVGLTLCNQDDYGEFIWSPAANGEFSLSSAFHEVRRSKNAAFSFTHA
ncbi:unnamed protein product, partial [Cuscuta epithymum]